MKESGVSMIRKTIPKKDVSSWMFYVLILLVVSMPLSEFGMSVSQFFLLGLWIHEGANFKNENFSKKLGIIHYFSVILNNLGSKFRLIYSNKPLLVIIAFYLLHLAGLFYTTDLNYGLKDIRVKLPLISLPIILATSSALDTSRFYRLMLFFCMAVVTATLVSMYVKFTRELGDPRELSIFISHIRFSLLICMSIFTLAYFIARGTFISVMTKVLMGLVLIWLVVFLFILKSLSGIIIGSMVVIVLTTVILFQYKKLIPLSITIIILFLGGSWYYLNNIFKDVTVASPVNLEQLDVHTSGGNSYSHDTVNFGIELGSYVGLYISEPELENAWNSRSTMNYNGLDKKEQRLKYTLIRYLHSKSLRKDANAINQLTNEEIKEIENGIANVNYLKSFNLRTRIEQLFLGYRVYMDHGDPNASSFMQRIEYWKTSLYLIKKQPVFGYGTGDVALEFNKAYEETNSRLEPEYRHRSHNQFLAIYIALGIPGVLLFIFSLIYPPASLGKFSNYFYLVFLVIAVLSMLTEDTLETQAGATFFAFFSALLLFGITKEVDYISTISHKHISFAKN